MRLAEFILENKGQIILEWENFAKTMVPAAADMSPLTLRDHIDEILKFVAADIEIPQTGPEQKLKSHGTKPKSHAPTAAETHAALRLAGGFDIDQMASEYRALRASVVRLWIAATPQPVTQDIHDLIRFNEAIDQELTESVSHYTKKVGDSKDLFLSILGHDIRTPLGAAQMSTQLLPQIGDLNERQAMLATQVSECIGRASEIVSNLLDLTRARFGSGLPVIKTEMDMGFLSRQMVEEMRSIYPARTIDLEVTGDLKGEWDKARIGQVFSNLISNATQYGFKDTPISVVVAGGAADILVSVHNQGVPIPPAITSKIFDSLTRGEEEGEQIGEVHLGLGLYITKEIVTAHGGAINVTSSEKEGTTFTAHFPR